MIQQFADWLIYDICGIDATTHLGEALNFFVYDLTSSSCHPKIFVKEFSYFLMSCH